MLSLFHHSDNKPGSPARAALTGPKVPRHSSGWSAMLKHLQEEPGLRVLDIGSTSPQNINFLTSLGHSVYMSDVVHEALSGAFTLPPKEEGAEPGFDTAAFFEQNLNFGKREFDVVLLWTTLDYIPGGLIQPLIDHLWRATRPGGRILAIFHTRTTGPDAGFYRYHVTASDSIEMQESDPHPVLRVYTNRGIEKLFDDFSNYRFFLAKDNRYEVIITR